MTPSISKQPNIATSARSQSVDKKRRAEVAVVKSPASIAVREALSKEIARERLQLANALRISVVAEKTQKEEFQLPGSALRWMSCRKW